MKKLDINIPESFCCKPETKLTEFQYKIKKKK